MYIVQVRALIDCWRDVCEERSLEDAERMMSDLELFYPEVRVVTRVV